MEKERRKQLIFIAQYQSQASKVPSKEVHLMRNKFNCFPVHSLTKDTSLFSIHKRKFFEIYLDETNGTEWVLQPWYLSLFHNPWKNCKFLAYDSSILAGAPGSSEIIVPKKAIVNGVVEVSQITEGSYNFHTKGFKHFQADILPNAIYCKCVGV